MNWRQEFLRYLLLELQIIRTTQSDGLKGDDGLSMEARLTSAMVKEFRDLSTTF